MHLAKRRFDVVNDQQIILLVIPPIFLAIATGVVIVRWRDRQVKRINTLVEDILCVCGLIMSLLVVVIVFVLVLVDGQGLSTQEVEAHFGERLKHRFWIRTQFAVDYCWATSITAVQLSLLWFYARIYSTRRFLLVSIYLMMGSVIAWFVYALAAWAYHCHPPGTCTLPNRGNCISIGSLHVAFNALIMCLAVPAITEMELTSKRRKLSVLTLFFLGTFCTVCAVLRMDCVFPFFGDIQSDPIGAAWGRMLLSPLEIAVGIIACSIPTLAPFHNSWQIDSSELPPGGFSHGLQRLRIRSDHGGSPLTHLHPASWVGKETWQNHAFVTLESGGKFSGDHIEVTKEYIVVHKT
ncbi:uncharacterized protein CC84DRAFT_57930 [Paraphaeosphaeria sporulosa]|uniref:Rhodopsin domain-containing protein n=1 Tax=Paraphaeosphaeria sporulosa TaxID=1460663 RepID=A0A177CYE1_9PLEO|nr:uncharacterized protein CC84DRAFT_57930 [Paraphaeosphaeria sporulosa]OAG11857.1 hypothetical protein CC84DRAFT_57930 [Paraphaeosphaeria sporulosa]